MQPGVTDLFGIEIPSTDPLFLTVIAVHILVGIAAVTFGAIAIFSKKGRGRHSRFGVRYYWAVVATVVTAALLTVLRFAGNLNVMTLGVLCLGALMFARLAIQQRWAGWIFLHITGMGLSYVLLLTAFYVENGAQLPLWNRLPHIAYWLAPTVVGLPIILAALWLHPLARCARRRGPDVSETSLL